MKEALQDILPWGASGSSQAARMHRAGHHKLAKVKDGFVNKLKQGPSKYLPTSPIF